MADPAQSVDQVAVIYARYSSHSQKEESIEQQVEECTAFAAQTGLKVLRVYADKALSGRTDKRPQFQKMMRDAEKKEFGIVIAYKSNRIARNMLQALQYEAKLDLFGIRTLYAKEEFGNTAAGRFALRTMMNVNQFYSENMAEDIRRGMRDNAEACKVNGAIPLGYVKGPDGRYAIEPKEAELVREIYDKVFAGETLISIANELNTRGLTTKQGHRWNKNSFHRILSNDNYIGVYRHSGFVKEDGIPPILEKEVFYAMQQHLDNKPRPRGRQHCYTEYLLAGKLFCGYCKTQMVGISGKTRDSGPQYFYYQCNKRRLDKACKKENVRKEWIETTVAMLTQKYILQDDVIEWIANSAMEVLFDAGKEAEIVAMEDELAETRKAVKNIMTAIEQGIFTASTKDRLLELEEEAATLERSITLAKAVTRDKTIDKERLIFSMEQLRDGDVRSAEFQKRLIDTFVKAVYLWDDRIEIDYYYTGQQSRVSVALETISGGKGEAQAEVRTSTPEAHHVGSLVNASQPRKRCCSMIHGTSSFSESDPLRWAPIRMGTRVRTRTPELHH